MEDTKIQWASHTFNPWIGCAKVHAGCLNCYAEELMADRYKRVTWGPNGTRKLTAPNNWKEPRKWNRKAEASGERPRVFCASLADIFEDWQEPMIGQEGQPVTMGQARAALFKLIDETPYLDWLILTKRPENILRMWLPHPDGGINEGEALYRHNVWLLTSVSDQASYEKQRPALMKCRDLVPVLGLSAEPLLGPIELRLESEICPICEGCGERSDWREQGLPDEICDECGGGGENYLRAEYTPDWIIAGGESGHDARPCDERWLLDLLTQCQGARVPFFMKQMGAAPELDGKLLGYEDPKGGDWDEWPDFLRVRQFPQVSHG